MTTPPAGTYTYSGDPSSSKKDQVRFLAQATGEDKKTGFVSDEEIQWILSNSTNVYVAAALVAERISAFFGSQGMKTIGPLTINARYQAQSYKELAADLRAQASEGGEGSGGPISLGNDTAIFAVGMTDYLGGGYYGYDQGFNSLLGWTP